MVRVTRPLFRTFLGAPALLTEAEARAVGEGGARTGSRPEPSEHAMKTRSASGPKTMTEPANAPAKQRGGNREESALAGTDGSEIPLALAAGAGEN